MNYAIQHVNGGFLQRYNMSDSNDGFLDFTSDPLGAILFTTAAAAMRFCAGFGPESPLVRTGVRLARVYRDGEKVESTGPEVNAKTLAAFAAVRDNAPNDILDQSIAFRERECEQSLMRVLDTFGLVAALMEHMATQKPAPGVDSVTWVFAHYQTMIEGIIEKVYPGIGASTMMTDMDRAAWILKLKLGIDADRLSSFVVEDADGPAPAEASLSPE